MKIFKLLALPSFFLLVACNSETDSPNSSSVDRKINPILESIEAGKTTSFATTDEWYAAIEFNANEFNEGRLRFKKNR